MNSREKGKRGEREFAAWLRGNGLSASRGQQFKGGADSPDVECPSLPGIHFEVKRVEAGSVYKWMRQAAADAGAGKTPVVAHRRNGEDWLVIMRAEDWLALVREATQW